MQLPEMMTSMAAMTRAYSNGGVNGYKEYTSEQEEEAARKRKLENNIKALERKIEQEWQEQQQQQQQQQQHRQHRLPKGRNG